MNEETTPSLSIRFSEAQRKHLQKVSTQLPHPRFGRLSSAVKFLVDEDIKRTKNLVKISKAS